MYDYVEINTSLLPISNSDKVAIDADFNEWLTVDYLNELGDIELRSDGTVWYTIYHERKIASPLTTTVALILDTTIEFIGYNSTGEVIYKFRVKMKDGKWFDLELVSIENI